MRFRKQKQFKGRLSEFNPWGGHECHVAFATSPRSRTPALLFTYEHGAVQKQLNPLGQDHSIRPPW